jgi:hypothetical protein
MVMFVPEALEQKARSMKILKYVGFVVCILLIFGTIPSIYLISSGLINGSVSVADKSYFVFKIIAYFAEIMILAYIAFRLFKSIQSHDLLINKNEKECNSA